MMKKAPYPTLASVQIELGGLMFSTKPITTSTQGHDDILTR